MESEIESEIESENYIQKYNKQWETLEKINENKDFIEWLFKLDDSEKVLL